MASPAFADVSMTHLVAILWHLAFAPVKTQAAAAGLYVGQGDTDGDNFASSVLHPPLQEGVYLTVSGMSDTVELLVTAVFQAWETLVDTVVAAAAAAEGEGTGGVTRSEAPGPTESGVATGASALQQDGVNSVAGSVREGRVAARLASIAAASGEGGAAASVGGGRAEEKEGRGQAALERYSAMLTAAEAVSGTSFDDVRCRPTPL